MGYAQAAIAAFESGNDSVIVSGSGNSMTPIIESGDKQTILKATPERIQELKKRDIVLVTVRGSTYSHLITAMRGRIEKRQYQISNNHGYVNGWVSAHAIHGLVVAIEGVPTRVAKRLEEAGLLPE